jgi:hypothetical protein
MTEANMYDLYISHIDDSIPGRENSLITFWGRFYGNKSFSKMESFLKTIRPFLENRSPPINVEELCGVFCVLINNDWQRARLLKPLKLNHHTRTLQVFCIDYGDTHVVPLSFVRTLEIIEKEAEHVRHWPPLATKCCIADIVSAPGSPGSHSCWSYNL